MRKAIIFLTSILISLFVLAFAFYLDGKSKPLGNSNLEIKLYYYNPEKDMGPGGVQCSEKGLVEVKRNIQKTKTPLFDSINLLIKGNLTTEERGAGVTSMFPLLGLQLVKADIKNGVATLEFADPYFKTSGGSCRAGVLWNQIKKTAMQFESVNEVRFLPETLFQP